MRFFPTLSLLFSALLLLTPAGLTLGQNTEEVPSRPALPADPQNSQNTGRVKVVFNGLTAMSDREARELLFEQITTLNKEGLTLAGADDTAFYLELRLRRSGYYEALVDYELAGPNQLVLDVNEGPRMTIGDVSLVGAESFPEDELKDFIIGPIREQHSTLDSELPFVANLIDDGAGLLERFYLNNGYTEAVVEPPQFDFRQETNTVDITVTVHEGPQYEFGDIEFRGELIFEPQVLLQRLKRSTIAPYSPTREAGLARKLQALYVERGYYEAKVTIDPLPIPEGTTRVPIRFFVQPGPLFTISDVTVVASERLKPRFLRNRFDHLIGKTYNPERMDKTYRKLLQTGIFTRLRLSPVKTGPDSLELQIEAEEGKTKSLGVYGGYGSFEGFILGGSWQDVSFWNTGRSFRATAEVTGRGFRGDVAWEDWWFLDTDIKFVGRASYADRDLDSYSKRQIGGSLSWGYSTKRWEVTAQFLPRQVDLYDTFLLPAETGPTEYFVNSFGIGASYDTRDNRFNPRAGLVLGISADYATPALGSDIEFLRLNYRAAYFIPIGPTVLSLAMQGGVVFAEGDTELIPIDERYFSGGSTTVRSFGSRELTPRNIFGEALGGNSTTVFNLELDFPLYQEIRGAVFFDAGNVLEASEPFNLENMRYAIGLGLRYELPVGMLRLDYGVNPDPAEFEEFGAFHFGFGFLF